MKKARNPSVKYTPELAAKICEAIEETGRDVDGIDAGRITKMSFYRWIDQKPDFRAAVEAARAHYKNNSLPQLRKFARGGLRRTLQAVHDGLEIVTTTTISGVGPDGEVDMETVQRKPAMVPIGQAFKFVMGEEIDLVKWLRQGVNLEIFPEAFVEDLIDDIDGVTDRIRSKLEGKIAKRETPGRSQRIDPSIAIASALGLTDPPPLSTSVDARQKPPKDLGEITADRS
jgi:hypothetical protein